MLEFDISFFKSQPDDFIGKTKELVDEIESNEYLANSFSFLLKDIPQETIINITKALDSCNFSEKLKSIKRLVDFWIRYILIVNGAVETDAIIELAKNAKTSFEDLVDTISHIEVLKADKDIFPFVTNLKNGCYFENNAKQLLDDYSSFLTAVSVAVIH